MADSINPMFSFNSVPRPMQQKCRIRITVPCSKGTNQDRLAEVAQHLLLEDNSVFSLCSFNSALRPTPQKFRIRITVPCSEHMQQDGMTEVAQHVLFEDKSVLSLCSFDSASRLKDKDVVPSEIAIVIITPLHSQEQVLPIHKPFPPALMLPSPPNHSFPRIHEPLPLLIFIPTVPDLSKYDVGMLLLPNYFDVMTRPRDFMCTPIHIEAIVARSLGTRHFQTNIIKMKGLINGHLKTGYTAVLAYTNNLGIRRSVVLHKYFHTCFDCRLGKLNSKAVYACQEAAIIAVYLYVAVSLGIRDWALSLFHDRNGCLVRLNPGEWGLIYLDRPVRNPKSVYYGGQPIGLAQRVDNTFFFCQLEGWESQY